MVLLLLVGLAAGQGESLRDFTSPTLLWELIQACAAPCSAIGAMAPGRMGHLYTCSKPAARFTGPSVLRSARKRPSCALAAAGDAPAPADGECPAAALWSKAKVGLLALEMLGIRLVSDAQRTAQPTGREGACGAPIGCSSRLLRVSRRFQHPRACPFSTLRVSQDFEMPDETEASKIVMNKPVEFAGVRVFSSVASRVAWHAASYYPPPKATRAAAAPPTTLPRKAGQPAHVRAPVGPLRPACRRGRGDERKPAGGPTRPRSAPCRGG